ncbi:MAG: hypothetical protein RL536_637 [Candidatus Parcubacteria bacterium]|jgi:cytochrome b involved in lipid metabolism
MFKKILPSIIFVIIVVVIALVITFAFFTDENSQSASTQNTYSVEKETLNSNIPSSSNNVSYTLAEVAKHNKSTDCWTTINGGVYNVTPWIEKHPGGSEAIISLCGIDGSLAFNGQHGGQENPQKALASFKIGTLDK